MSFRSLGFSLLMLNIFCVGSSVHKILCYIAELLQDFRSLAKEEDLLLTARGHGKRGRGRQRDRTKNPRPIPELDTN